MRGNPDDLANQDLAEIYEALVGADGMERYTHAELIEYIHQLKTIEEENASWSIGHLKKLDIVYL